MAIFSRRRGFTLVELLVVITIIGLLMALLLPAVQAVRERSRTLTCMNNMGQLAKAMINYDSSKGQYPGYVQNIAGKNNGEFISGLYDNSNGYTVTSTASAPVPLSWAAMLLPKIERQDVWDAIVSADSDNVKPNVIRREATFVCPSDAEARANADRPALSYVGNTGAWDRTGNGRYLTYTKAKPPVQGLGDSDDNGVMHDLALGKQKLSMGGIKDGAGTTLLLAENNSKTYTTTNSMPAFTWAYSLVENGREQHFGFVWVVSQNPQTGSDVLYKQEPINRNISDVATFDPLNPI